MEQEQVGAWYCYSSEQFESTCFRGINVLGKKSELEKVLAKQRKASEENSDEHRNEVENEFKKVLSERARRLEKVKFENQDWVFGPGNTLGLTLINLIVREW